MISWLTPYFTFNGNCGEAVKFYQKILGGEAKIMHFGGMPPNPAFPVPENVKHLLIDAQRSKLSREQIHGQYIQTTAFV